MDPRQKRKRPRRLGTDEELAALLNVRVEAIRNARSTGKGDLATIPWFKFGEGRGARVRVDLNWVEDVWLPRRMRSHGELDAA
jgi:hypothetical protein